MQKADLKTKVKLFRVDIPIDLLSGHLGTYSILQHISPMDKENYQKKINSIPRTQEGKIFVPGQPWLQSQETLSQKQTKKPNKTHKATRSFIFRNIDANTKYLPKECFCF